MFFTQKEALKLLSKPLFLMTQNEKKNLSFALTYISTNLAVKK
jgi:hypothetical protein